MATDPNKKKKRRKHRVRRLVLLLLLLALGAAVVYFYALPKLRAGATITYDAYTAHTGTISNALSFSGSVNVKNSETLTADGSAIVRKIYVREGESVVRDQKLMRLSDGTTLKANFDGEINEISVEEGDSVSMNASLIQVVDFQNMTVSMRVDEYSISELQVGQGCTVTIKALGQTFDSQIAKINRISSGGGSTAYYTVTVELNVTEDVLPGMQATVSIPMEESVDGVILDMDALTFARNNSAYVLMKDENGEMQQVYVEVGVDNDKYIAITSGLNSGDVVYKVSESTASAAGGIMSLFSSMTGGGMPGGGMDFGGGSSGSGSGRGNKQRDSGGMDFTPSGGGFGGFGGW